MRRSFSRGEGKEGSRLANLQAVRGAGAQGHVWKCTVRWATTAAYGDMLSIPAESRNLREEPCFYTSTCMFLL